MAKVLHESAGRIVAQIEAEGPKEAAEAFQDGLPKEWMTSRSLRVDADVCVKNEQECTCENRSDTSYIVVGKAEEAKSLSEAGLVTYGVFPEEEELKDGTTDASRQ